MSDFLPPRVGADEEEKKDTVDVGWPVAITAMFFLACVTAVLLAVIL